VGGHLDGAAKDDVFGRNSDLGKLFHFQFVGAAEFGAQFGQSAQNHRASVTTGI